MIPASASRATRSPSGCARASITPAHLDAEIAQVQRGLQAAPLTGHHHRARSGPHAPQARQPQRAGSEHHARQIVVFERQREVHRARRHDQRSRAQLDQLVAAASRRSTNRHRCRWRSYRSESRRAPAWAVCSRRAASSANDRPAQDPFPAGSRCARLGCGLRRAQPGRTAADHGHVRVLVDFRRVTAARIPD